METEQSFSSSETEPLEPVFVMVSFSLWFYFVYICTCTLLCYWPRYLGYMKDLGHWFCPSHHCNDQW